MEEKKKPIGFYDSGVGGISVLRQTIKLLPGEDYIYFGDSANAPYGMKDEEEIRRFSLACGDFLHQKNVKAIVIACNTATSIVVKTMRENYNIPVISMEPAVKPAKEAHRAGDILVLATPATLKQARYHALLARLSIRDRVVDVECAGLAELVENGDLSNPQIKACIYEKLRAHAGRKNVCALVIGCTHYSFISDQINEVAKKLLRGSCEIYDGMYGTARRTAGVLSENDLLNPTNRRGTVRFFSSLQTDTESKFRHFLEL
ncbi:MAG TPA: glutamate racemase [Clostridiales bacterium]|nr:glutamate racemase [Clostridiales bacterium]